ncbi:MAG: hypothetical protein U0N82_10360, partial [Oscillospiraceae bacterium]
MKSQPVSKSVYTNQKNGVCIYTSQNEKIPTVSTPIRIGKTVGISYAAFIVLKMTCSTFLTKHISAAEVLQDLILLFGAIC